MGRLLFIDSDDIGELSEALQKALERRGIIFCGNEEIPSDTDVFVDDAPMPSGCGSTRSYGSRGYGGSVHCISSCGGGSCGHTRSGGCGYSGC